MLFLLAAVSPAPFFSAPWPFGMLLIDLPALPPGLLTFLWSARWVLLRQLGDWCSIFYETVKKAKLFFRSTTESEIKKYIQENKTAVFSSVGSYRIEDNKKYNLVEILSGDNETIIGFPIKNLLEKFKNE